MGRYGTAEWTYRDVLISALILEPGNNGDMMPSLHLWFNPWIIIIIGLSVSVMLKININVSI